MSMFTRARARSERRSIIRSMLGMSEKELRDIGVSRYQLERALDEVDDPRIFEKVRRRSLRELPF